MDTNNIKELLDKYLAGAATPAEQVLIEKWLEQTNFPENTWNSMNSTEQSVWINYLHDELLKKITERPGISNDSSISIFRRSRLYFYLAAASVIMLVLIGGWFFISQLPANKEPIATLKQTHYTDALPGTNKAALTLDNGDTIILDDYNNGVIASHGNTEINKRGGQLIYSRKHASGAEQSNVYHTLSTPRGGQYSLVLPDASRVWLNAGSSIRYPVRFTGNTRDVEIKGEVYFEVTSQVKNEKRTPFIVHVLSTDGAHKSSIEVLGTHFNINAYDEESSINTTLLEGKVKVILTGHNELKKPVFLSPGQQARIDTRGEIKVIDNPVIEEIIAWKNGLFLMNSVEIPVVLRQLARWYDVDIVYEGKAPEGRITGDIPMQMKLSEVLKVLELSGVKFKAEERKIIVEAKK
jgi:transmembrane sensor